MAQKRTSHIKETVQHQFSQVAANYRTSQVHARGEELDRMVFILQQNGAKVILDAGSGPGHTALVMAPHAEKVVALDLSLEMLSQGQLLADERQISNVEFRQGDVEELPFPAGSFDAVVSRFSAHHWPEPLQALRNCRHVLQHRGGCLLLADTVSFAHHTVDTHVQAIELLRDPSHVRDHTPEQWMSMLGEAGFAPEIVYTWDLRIDFASWIARMATPPDVAAIIHKLMRNAPSEVQTALQIGEDGSFTHRCALLKAVPF